MKTRFPGSLFIRASLILAIIAGSGASVLNLSCIRLKIMTLQSDVKAQALARERAETELTTVKNTLSTTLASLATTKASLETTRVEKEQALVVASAQAKRADKFSRDLAETNQKLDNALAYLARYRESGMEPEQILSAAKELKTLQTALAAAEHDIKSKDQTIKSLQNAQADTVSLPAELKAKVVASDPKWHFVVLDAGEKEGVLERGELLLSRHGKLVAKARVARVQQGRCIANLLPGWEFSEVMEGDIAIPVLPRT